MTKQPPFTLGMDVCGVVTGAGAGAEPWIGRRVVGISKDALGGIAEYTVAPAVGVFDAPESLSDEEAAAFLIQTIRREGDRPRAEIQPIEIGRQRPVRSGQHEQGPPRPPNPGGLGEDGKTTEVLEKSPPRVVSRAEIPFSDRFGTSV